MASTCQFNIVKHFKKKRRRSSRPGCKIGSSSYFFTGCPAASNASKSDCCRKKGAVKWPTLHSRLKTGQQADNNSRCQGNRHCTCCSRRWGLPGLGKQEVQGSPPQGLKGVQKDSSRPLHVQSGCQVKRRSYRSGKSL